MGISRTSFSLRTRGRFWVGQSSTATAASLLLALCVLGTPVSAAAQDMDALLQRKYDIQQQQVDAERIRAETERMRAEAQVSQSNGQASRSRSNTSADAQQYFVSANIDSLAGVNAPTYRQGNGVLLRVSGAFWPDLPTVCIANCL